MRDREPDMQDLLRDLRLDDGPGPALVLSEREAARQLEAALDRGLPRVAPRRRWPLWVAAAATVCLGLPAGAALWQFVSPSPPPARVARPRPAPVRPVEPAPPPVAPAPPPVQVEPAPAPQRRPKPRRRVRAAEPPAPAPSPSASADALLDAASRLRGAQQWAPAAQAYERVVQAHPEHSAAYVARVSAAALYLEHLQDPARAARLYRAALAQRPNGPLDASTRWNLARAYRALGQTGPEREILQEVLRRHPEAVHSAQARARLQQLEASR